MPYNDTLIGPTISENLVLLLNTDKNKPEVTVGQSIQPDVANFLADSFPWSDQMVFLPFGIEEFDLFDEDFFSDLED